MVTDNPKPSYSTFVVLGLGGFEDGVKEDLPAEERYQALPKALFSSWSSLCVAKRGPHETSQRRRVRLQSEVQRTPIELNSSRDIEVVELRYLLRAGCCLILSIRIR